MLEKIGLPAKPSMRGASWVVDASHCQGCSSQFTFINRKHHCRRCGGIFCNSCTRQRMVLRGQGDSPVRICDPCKNLEDAARFELRFGHKNRAAKSSSIQGSRHEEVLSEILGTDGKQPLQCGHESHTDVISDLLHAANSPASVRQISSSSGINEHNMSGSAELHNHSLNDTRSVSPEELRQQAVDEKKKYKILKGEGKPEEALLAFKRGKELERQAAALEITLRKNRRMASKAPNLSSAPSVNKTDDSEESGSKKKKIASQFSKDDKGDLAAELRELGWSDADLRDADKKAAKLTLDGELSNILSEIPREVSRDKGTGGIDKSQVIAHKRQALIFKREGRLAEAKEELKKAKIIEKQVEEQELLGGADNSDDELLASINSMDDDEKHDNLLLDHMNDPGVDFHHLLGVTDDLAVDENFEVTDDDMHDPELAAALKSFGWTEEDDNHINENDWEPAPLDQQVQMSKVAALKREALSQKRAGNVAEARNLLNKAKLLEKNMQEAQSDRHAFAPESTPMNSSHQTLGQSTNAAAENSSAGLPPKSKLAIQKELLAIKKYALALRRGGKIQEADEELKKGKVLETQLEEMDNAVKRPGAQASRKNVESYQNQKNVPGTIGFVEEGEDAEFTEQDMHDPTLLSGLKDLGWQDEDVETTSMASQITKQMKDHTDNSSILPAKPLRSKAEIRRELLGIKRKALALRRQGKTEEAEEENERAKALENQMAEMEAFCHTTSIEMESHKFETSNPRQKVVEENDGERPPETCFSGVPPESTASVIQKLGPGPKAESWLEEWVSSSNKPAQTVSGLDPLLDSQRLVSQLAPGKLGHKEVSDVAYISQGIASSNEDQISVKGSSSSNNAIVSHSLSRTEMDNRQEENITATDRLVTPEEMLVHNPKHGFDTLKGEILAHKKKALALKREGRMAEAKEELRQAKLLERSPEDGQKSEVDSGSIPASVSNDTPVMQDSRPKQTQKPLSSRDRLKLQQESLAHKRNALKLRREGKLAESEAELELAKELESQLEEYSAEGSSSSKVSADDVVVEDLLDPQLMLALKSIGWSDNDLFTEEKKPEPKPTAEKVGKSVLEKAQPNAEKVGKSVLEKAQLEEQIKNEKLCALNLKRAGKQAEALEALRTAKRLEKKLVSLNS